MNQVITCLRIHFSKRNLYALTLLLYSVSISTGITLSNHRFPCKLPKERRFTSACGLRTFFLPRSQGWNSARHLAGWQETLPGCDERVWGDWTATLEHTRSFHGERIAHYLFGTNCLSVVGSEVLSRNNTHDLVADYFGLLPTFKGTLCFKPSIENWILDINFHLGLDSWAYGLYFKVNAPIVRTKWNLGMRCREKKSTLKQLPICYMSSQKACALKSIKQAFAGQVPFGDAKTPWMFGSFSCKSLHKSDIANIDLILGWNFILNHTGHLGIFLLAALPAGNKPNNIFIFEPIVGNGHKWEFGPGMTGHYIFYEHGCQNLGIYFEGNFTRLLRSHEIRSFDFKSNGPLSRYLLLKEFTKSADYRYNLLNSINYTTHAVRAGGSTKTDWSVKLAYYKGEWGADLGYNSYYKSLESICINSTLHPSDFTYRIFGIKGTEPVCSKIDNKIIANNTTQNNATITHAGKPNRKPCFVHIKDLDTNSARVPKQITHKIFGHLSYTNLTRCAEPQIGIGGEIEFDGSQKRISSLNQWGIWLKCRATF